jgi:NAD+ kinase
MHPTIMRKTPALALLVSDTPRAVEAAEALREDNAFVPLEEADVAVVLGGDGQMLHALHQMLDTGHVIPAYGLNLGTVGFLMNKPKSSRLLAERIARAKPLTVTPLAMTATLGSGQEGYAPCAINEVSLLRETRQTAKLEVSVNGKRADGRTGLATACWSRPRPGSTAYNLSANGPILPLGSALLALTPISPFRPRRWRGAILPDHYEITFRVLDPEKRPVAAVADQKELRDIVEVQVKVAREHQLTLLFDPQDSWKSGSSPNSSRSEPRCTHGQKTCRKCLPNAPALL